MKRRAVVCAVLLALAVSACARQEPPSDSITALGAGEDAEGFTTTQLPAATAFASGSMASMNG